ncbi:MULTISPECIES: RpiB/LacA/LacB family sugar-phosphate isomerase [Holospora]|uniref:Putative sugar phosphate isomerase n=2 Tax=Holospora TaxID=44747 RepID=A0A061JG71_9PROT|nr:MULTISPECIES: RpiB/LacA/LacB family sugar-phosphate isomerase [Holospora]ETZ04850.1 putative sugar phosphate isomerase [Holospora undulata HU1]GAJ46099.1 putative sugar phosphate isomerase [Holospora elegans E1]
MKKKNFNVCFGFDHAGKDLSFFLMEKLLDKGNIVLCPQRTCMEEDPSIPILYPAVVPLVVQEVLKKETWGVLVCGSGIGMSIAANRYLGIRAALCKDTSDAVLARQHNNANILVLAGRTLHPDSALHCLLEFLFTDFSYGRHSKRVEMLDHMPFIG